MRFAVTFRSEFETIKVMTNYFNYCEDKDYPIKYLDAPNREAAARKFLSADFEQQMKEDKNSIQRWFDSVMKNFISCCVDGGEPILKCQKQEEYSKLVDDIYDSYSEEMMLAGKVNILIDKNEETSCLYDEDDEDCLKKVQEKFPASCLFDLMTDEEKKELYIDIMREDVMVILLEKL